MTSVQSDTTPAAQGRPHPESAVISIHRADLPLSCPRPEDVLWNMHPRVYLPIEDEPSGQVTCPYCGATYRLVD